ncbi:response regulator [Bifidobacterium vansinderenii]|uniref:LuxR family transcriptional regulator n=1 Tax=Bifidobacterium vansinderenii TaxID=1984871 RepID=A0A229VXE6_9BIFI|nr:response regulator [Bifidobacterium vansinderenii]OXN00070.1 LuxR family transcriptional regulator [Bifidobacterium vansinderenii]
MQSRTEKRPSIAVVDNDPYTLEMLSTVIRERFSAFDLAWTTTRGSTAVSRCLDKDSRPSLLLVDMSLGDRSGVQVCHDIRKSAAQPALLAITSFTLERYAAEAAKAGAQGIVHKESISDLATSIAGILHDNVMTLSLHNGTVVVFETAPKAHVRLRSEKSNKPKLTAVETEVIKRCMKGESYIEIGRTMHVTPSTVRSYIHRLNKKLGARTLSQAIAIWIRQQEDFIGIFD